jgi:hypothetical protein
MRRVIAVEKKKYTMPMVRSVIEFGYSAHSVPYSVPAGPGRSNLYWRTEYRPNNTFKTEHGSSEIEYWRVELDDGAHADTSWYLFAPQPNLNDEFYEYRAYDIPIWMRIGEKKTYSNVVLGGAAAVAMGVVWTIGSLLG